MKHDFFAHIPSLSRVLTGALLAWAAWLLAQISWQLAFPPEYSAGDEEAASLSREKHSPPAVPRGLFGAADRGGPSPESRGLPATTLPLTLTGLLASSDARLALAVILYQGRQASYAVGDKLPVPAVGVRIGRITADGVVLDEPGGATILRYPSSRAGAPAAKSVLPDDLTRQLAQRPAEIADYLTVAPVREGGELRGYRINPGRKPALFGKLGFEPGDLAVAINGADLRDNQQAQQILLQLPQLRTVTVSVDRDGQRYDISVSLDEGSL